LRGMGASRMAGAIAKLIPKDRAELVRLLNQVATHLEARADSVERPASA
jgi:hypothetical protein